ncbi:transposase [Sorangium sp. So ce1097]|uniref:transposase n=1 Tax=Sorangium sp. So ce1097 TaxID=3133330 RepID=UPI003F60AF6D
MSKQSPEDESPSRAAPSATPAADEPALDTASTWDQLHECRNARRVHLIWDGAPSHVAQETTTLLRTLYPHVRVLVTPAHASWLNQAELLLRAFGERYLKRGSWNSRQQLVEHLDASWREYDQLYAHPFRWSWTRQNMHRWVARHAA